jgi:23S rRNA pseudouridine1911/1915/1917 synthase
LPIMTEQKEVEILNLTVAPGQTEPVRIDKYLTEMVKNATRNKVQQAIKDGRVTVNEVQIKSSYIVQPDDNIRVELTRPKPPDAEPEAIDLDIVFEDDSLIVVNKPAGLVVHPAFGNWTGTLVNALLYHAEQLSDYQDDALRPGIVHRLDKDTSGLLVVAKNSNVHKHLAEQFSKHAINRRYWAVVWGRPDDEGTFDSEIGRSNKDRKVMAVLPEGKGKRAVTHYKVIERFDHLALVEVKLETGRTHQIRVHFAGAGYPIFGDETYGGNSVRFGSNTGRRKTLFEKLFKTLSRQCLHAKTLGFIHPETREEVSFDSELPADFSFVIEQLRKYCT